MSVWFHYFAAPSDDAAAAMLDHGPAGPEPEPPPPALVEARRTGDPEAEREALRQLRRPKVRESASGTLVLKTTGISVINLGELEALLTGTSNDEILGRYGEPLAIDDDWGSPFVERVNDELQTALINATEDQLNAVVVPWSQPWLQLPFPGPIDLDILTEFVRELAVLARTACERGERLYCWVCV